MAIPSHKIAIECEGGVYTMGRHTRPTGYINDMEKYNHATLLGWRLLRFTPKQINIAIPMIKELYASCNQESKNPSQTDFG